MMFNALMQKIVSSIPVGDSVVELGSQTMVDGKGNRSSAEDFYRGLGWKNYTALDLDGQWGAQRMDLNEPFFPAELTHPPSVDLVTNNGTGEHLFGVANALEMMHFICDPGGLIVHVMPFTGWINHGFWSFHPILFRDLAEANGYAIEGLFLAERNGRMEAITEAFHHPKPGEPLSTLEQQIQGFGTRANVSVVAMLRMPKEKGAFVVPMQQKYADVETKPSAPAIMFEKPAEVILDPFPHVVIKPALPQELYDELAAAFPDAARISGKQPDDAKIGNVLHQLSAKDIMMGAGIDPIWQRFVATHTGPEWLGWLLDLFAPHMQPLMKRLPQKDMKVGVRGTGQFDLTLDCQLCINTPVKMKSRVRGPHVDDPTQLIGGLMYFAEPDDDAGGDLVLCDWRLGVALRLVGKAECLDDDVAELTRVPYEPNTLVLFACGPDSIHGVLEREPTDKVRRYVNFIVNAAGPLFEMPPHDREADQSALRESHRR